MNSLDRLGGFMLSFKFVLTFLFIYNITLSNSIKESYSEITSKIISRVSKDSTAYKRLAYICDTFGPRLSGSRNLENSIEGKPFSGTLVRTL